MGWRTIVISNPCRLSVKNRHLSIEPREGEAAMLPLSDISVVMIETPQCLVTSALLSAIADEGVALFACDASHTPNGLFAPFASHSRHTKAALLQVAWSEPFKKRCWQKIIEAKIKNQAKLLKHVGNDTAYKRLTNIASKVLSDDSTNCEAQAASVYWQSLFEGFRRGSQGEDVRNSALNYGYAVLRGVIARSVAASGLIPAFGLHHKSELNAFNLADDMIEPFRPLVDMLVWEMYEKAGFDTNVVLTKDDKMELVRLLGEKCKINSQNETILNACDIAAQSLSSCGAAKSHTKLLLPTFSDV